MQTFLPLPCIRKSVACLDSVRLNKQRVECKQICNALAGEYPGWSNHPAVKMYATPGGMSMLAEYVTECCNECDARGIADHVDIRSWFDDFFMHQPDATDGFYPWWWASTDLRLSHRNNLYWKNSHLYKQFKPSKRLTEKPPYVWPIHANEYEILSTHADQARIRVIRYAAPRIVSGPLAYNALGHASMATRDKSGKLVTWLFEAQ